MDSSSQCLKKNPINQYAKNVELKVPQLPDNAAKKEVNKPHQSQILKLEQNHPWSETTHDEVRKSQGKDCVKNTRAFNQDRFKRSQEIHHRPYKDMQGRDPSIPKPHILKKSYQVSRKVR